MPLDSKLKPKNKFSEKVERLVAPFTPLRSAKRGARIVGKVQLTLDDLKEAFEHDEKGEQDFFFFLHDRLTEKFAKKFGKSLPKK